MLHFTDNGKSIKYKKTVRKEVPSYEELLREKLEGTVTHAPLGRDEFHNRLEIMAAIYKETGEVAFIDGMTSMDQERHYRTEPALKLLSKKTWRQFFDEMNKNQAKNGNSNIEKSTSFRFVPHTEKPKIS